METQGADPHLALYDRLITRGDVDGDGVEDAVILLEDNTSGTGRFVYAVAVLDVLGRPTPTPPLMLGDRIQVKSLSWPAIRSLRSSLGRARATANVVRPGTCAPSCGRMAGWSRAATTS